MRHNVKPFVIIGFFWMALFIFVIAGYSGEFGFSAITGNVVREDGAPSPIGVQAVAILVLFFTNLVTLFFLVREMALKP